MLSTPAPPAIPDASEIFTVLTGWGKLPCCHTDDRVLQLPPASEQGSCSNECESACLAEADCNFFSFDAKLRRCWFCEKLSNVTQPLQARTCATRQVTWVRRRAEPLLLNRTYQRTGCAKYGFAFARQGRKPKEPPPKKELVRSYKEGMAKFLGMPTDDDVDGSPTPSSSCAEQGEERAFRETCSEQIQTLDRHLAATRGRRAIWFNIDGISEWGWGNLMPIVFLLHWLCLHAGRYCYIRLMDQEMGVMGYANGDAWGADSEQAVYRLFGSSKNVTEIINGFAWTLWRNATRLNMLAQELRDHEAPLLNVYFPAAYPIQSNALLPFFRNIERLPISSRAGIDGPWWSGKRRMDRCFCRYVTQPRIEEVVAKLPSPLHALISRYEAAPARVAVHLRTM